MFRTSGTRPDSEPTAFLDSNVDRVDPANLHSSASQVVIAALLSAGLNLPAEQYPTVWTCCATLLQDTLGYVQNIRYLEYGACTLGKV